MDDQGEHISSQCQQDWIEAQNLLKMRLLVEDHFDWCMPSRESSTEEKSLRYIGGVDLSFSKEDPALACAALVVVDAKTMDVVHEEFEVVRLRIPYVPGFLAFREAPILLALLNKMKCDAHPLYPQLLMVDGNGLLHPRGFGLACHLGVLADIPTIGIGKNAMRSSPGSSKPVYISIGHRISLKSSVEIVKLCSKYRVPEPVRQADIRSKVHLQKLKGQLHVTDWPSPTIGNEMPRESAFSTQPEAD